MTKPSKIAAAVLAAVGSAYAAPSAAADCVDVCVAYPYYGKYTTEASAAFAGSSSGALAPDVCVVHPYYGETTTALSTTVPGSGLVETPEELKRVMAAFGRDQYLGL